MECFDLFKAAWKRFFAARMPKRRRSADGASVLSGKRDARRPTRIRRNLRFRGKAPHDLPPIYYIKKAPACKAQAGRARRAVHAGEHAAAGNLVVRIQHVAVKAETPAFVDARASAAAELQLHAVAGHGERKAIDAIQK